MTLQQYLPVFWERRRLISTAYLLVVVLTLLVSLWMPKQYIAAVSLLIDVKNDPIVGTVLPDMTSQNYMANQVEIVQSDRVALRVIKLLGTEHQQSVMESWEKRKDKARLSFENYYIKSLEKGLKVKTSPINNLMTISFAGTDPQFVADAANAFSEAYIDTAIDLRVEPARQAAAWYEERLSSLRTALKLAKANLSNYQKEKGILASDPHRDQESPLLTALNTKLAESQKRRISAGSDPLAAAQDNPVIREINAELRKARNQLNQMSIDMGVNYPPRRHLESQIEALKQQLNEEIRHQPSVSSPVQQEAALNALIAAEQRKVLAHLAENDDIAMLTKDVETAQQAYEVVAQRAGQINLESKTEQANVSILTPAQLPTEASRPRVLLNFLVSQPAGLLLGILLAIAIESLDRRVRSVYDLDIDGDLPILGTLRPEVGYSRLDALLSGAVAAPRSLPYRGRE